MRSSTSCWQSHPQVQVPDSWSLSTSVFFLLIAPCKAILGYSVERTLQVEYSVYYKNLSLLASIVATHWEQTAPEHSSYLPMRQFAATSICCSHHAYPFLLFLATIFFPGGTKRHSSTSAFIFWLKFSWRAVFTDLSYASALRSIVQIHWYVL